MKKNFMKYSILIGAGMILGVVASNIGNVFGAQDPGQDDPNIAETIVNTACIEYTTTSGTGIKCDDVIVTLKTGNVQGPEYFIKKWQKTGGMNNFTDEEISVALGEYIQYKVDFGSITGTCRNGIIEDTLPSCVKYVSSSIVGVSGPSLATGEHFVQYSGFRLNSNSSGYILVTGKILEGAGCEDATRYVNTGGFKCTNPSSNWIYSSVVARRQGGGQGGSGVVFTKSGNKTEMVPGETGLVFTLTVVNNGPNNITGVTIDDIWPNPNGKNCIIFEGWSGSAWSRDGNAYTRYYTKNNGVLRSKGGSATLQLYASIADESYCVGSYINTGKLTYHELGNTYTLTGYHQFKVVDAGAGYDVSIEKTVYPNGNVSHNQDIKYTITYKNIGTKPLTNYTIIDNRPNDKLEFKNSTPTPLTNNGDTITWHFSGPLQPGEIGTIIINARVR